MAYPMNLPPATAAAVQKFIAGAIPQKDLIGFFNGDDAMMNRAINSFSSGGDNYDPEAIARYSTEAILRARGQTLAQTAQPQQTIQSAPSNAGVPPGYGLSSQPNVGLGNLPPSGTGFTLNQFANPNWQGGLSSLPQPGTGGAPARGPSITDLLPGYGIQQNLQGFGIPGYEQNSLAGGGSWAGTMFNPPDRSGAKGDLPIYQPQMQLPPAVTGKPIVTGTGGGDTGGQGSNDPGTNAGTGTTGGGGLGSLLSVLGLSPKTSTDPYFQQATPVPIGRSVIGDTRNVTPTPFNAPKIGEFGNLNPGFTLPGFSFTPDTPTTGGEGYGPDPIGNVSVNDIGAYDSQGNPVGTADESGISGGDVGATGPGGPSGDGSTGNGGDPGGGPMGVRKRPQSLFNPTTDPIANTAGSGLSSSLLGGNFGTFAPAANPVTGTTTPTGTTPAAETTPTAQQVYDYFHINLAKPYATTPYNQTYSGRAAPYANIHDQLGQAMMGLPVAYPGFAWANPASIARLQGVGPPGGWTSMLGFQPGNSYLPVGPSAGMGTGK